MDINFLKDFSEILLFVTREKIDSMTQNRTVNARKRNAKVLGYCPEVKYQMSS